MSVCGISEIDAIAAMKDGFTIFAGSAISVAPETSCPMVPSIWNSFYGELKIIHASNEALTYHLESFDKFRTTNNYLGMPFETQMAYLQMHEDGRAFNEIVKLFEISTQNHNHKAIGQLNRTGILERIYTTNFDFGLDLAIGVRENNCMLKLRSDRWSVRTFGPAEFYFTSAESYLNPKYVKLHGSAGIQRNVSTQDMGITIERIGSGYHVRTGRTLSKDFLSKDKPILFIGFGGSDVDLLRFLYELRSPREVTKTIYWAVKPGDGSRERPRIFEFFEDNPIKLCWFETDLSEENILTMMAGISLSRNENSALINERCLPARNAARMLSENSVLSFLGHHYLYLNRGKEAEEVFDHFLGNISSTSSGRESRFIETLAHKCYANAIERQNRFEKAYRCSVESFWADPSFLRLLTWAVQFMISKNLTRKLKKPEVFLAILLALLYFPLGIYGLILLVIPRLTNAQRYQSKELSELFGRAPEMLFSHFRMRILGSFLAYEDHFADQRLHWLYYVPLKALHIMAMFARRLAQKGGQIREEALALRPLGTYYYYRSLGRCVGSFRDSCKAVSFYEEALFVLAQIGIHNAQTDTLRYLSGVRRYQSYLQSCPDYLAEARNLLLKALKLASDIDGQYNPIEAAKACLELYNLESEPEKKREYLEKAKEFTDAIEEEESKGPIPEYIKRIENCFSF